MYVLVVKQNKHSLKNTLKSSVMHKLVTCSLYAHEMNMERTNNVQNIVGEMNVDRTSKHFLFSF